MVCLVLGLSSVANALDTNYSQIRKMNSWTDGVIGVWLTDVEHECSHSDTKRYRMLTTIKGFDEKFSLLIVAKLSGQKVSFKYNCGDDGVPLITGVRFI